MCLERCRNEEKINTYKNEKQNTLKNPVKERKTREEKDRSSKIRENWKSILKQEKASAHAKWASTRVNQSQVFSVTVPECTEF